MRQIIDILIEKWASPAGLIAIGLGVVWLIQLQMSAEQVKERMAAIEAVQFEMVKTLQDISVNNAKVNARQTTLIESIFAQMEEMYKSMQRNEAMIYNNSQHGNSE